MLFDRAVHPSLLQCSVGKGTFLTYFCQISVFLGTMPSAPILWELTQKEIFCELLLFGWAISKSQLGEHAEGSGGIGVTLLISSPSMLNKGPMFAILC
jgi:hypothetical protein